MTKSQWRRLMVALILPVFLVTNSPLPAALAVSKKTRATTVVAPEKSPVVPKVGSQKVRTGKIELTFSSDPSDVELSNAHALEEPLIPMSGKPTSGENSALAKALLAYLSKHDPEDVSDLAGFIAQFPESRWRSAVELNLGLQRWQTGYLSDAIDYLNAAWERSKNEAGQAQRQIADRAGSELAIDYARLGKLDELKQTFSEVRKRPLHGSNEQRVEGTREALRLMEQRPDKGYKCGPYAVDNVLNASKPAKRSKAVEDFPSTKQGTSLQQVRDLAERVGLKYRAAKRTSGAPFVVPSVMHWKLGHFGAITKSEKGRYQVKDPTFGSAANMWLSAKALEKESDGYFLIPQGALPSGWEAVSEQEAKNVWGKGGAPFSWPDDTGGGCGQSGGCKGGSCKECEQGGMATANAWSMMATEHISDTPLGYSPPVGPAPQFTVEFTHLLSNQPSSFTFTNLGFNWTFNWISYMTLDASNNATLRKRGGGSETYANQGGPNPYAPNLITQATLVPIVAGSHYERRLPDGSVEVFNLSDSSSPVNIFMTQVKDPQGNSVSIGYDSNFRVTTITDTIGQQSTISYVSNTFGNSGFYKIASIQDPFSRSCSFSYDSTNTLLLSITDVISLQSQFSYDSASSFINTLTTPYGTTGFAKYITDVGTPGRAVRIMYPDGSVEVTEAWLGEEKSTHFFDRHAMELYPNVPASIPSTYTNISTKTQWLRDPSNNYTRSVVNQRRTPLINATVFTYPGQTLDYVGTINKPITVTGPSPAGDQTYTYQYNSIGNMTQSIDPVGRKFDYDFATNGIDLLAKRQTRSTNNDYVGQWQNYNSQHEPTLYIDGSGRHWDYAYNTRGQLTTVTDPNSNVTTRSYDTNGYLTQIDGPLSGNQDVTTFSFDSYGRVRTVTDSEGYVLTYDYDLADRLIKVTYPDGTTEETVYNRLDAVQMKDRIGRWTQRGYDAIQQLVFEVDPLGRKTSYDWCTCGSLAKLTDPAGNITRWSHDIIGRPTSKIYADGTKTSYSYWFVCPQLQSVTDALGQVKTHNYFLDGTLSGIVYTNEINPTTDVSYTWDPDYRRIKTVANGWGTITYNYNAYISSPTGTTTGGGMVSTVTNNVIANSTISYQYDNLGRTTNRSINGSANSIDWAYDAMSRVTSETNALSASPFQYKYVDDTPGSSKGTTRLASINYPNGQVTNFTWYDNNGDQRLRGIENLKAANGDLLSRFSYSYNPAGEINNWVQQTGGRTPVQYALGYDNAGQLASVRSGGNGARPPYVNELEYFYDPASNRTSVQRRNAPHKITIGGTVTVGQTVYVTVLDAGLTNGQQTAKYVVQSGDTTSTIAAGLAVAINNNTTLQALGVGATATGTTITVYSGSPNLTTYQQGGYAVGLSTSVNPNGVTNGTVGGTVQKNKIVTVTVFDSALAGGQQAVSYTTQNGDTYALVAEGLKNAINNNTNLANIGVTATHPTGSNWFSINSYSVNTTTYTWSTTGQVTITFAANTNTPKNAIIGGTTGSTPQIFLTFNDTTLPGGIQSATYQVLAGDSLAQIAEGLKNAVNANANLQKSQITATHSPTSLNWLTIRSNSTATTAVTGGFIGGHGQTLTIAQAPNTSNQSNVVSGVVSLPSSLTITVTDGASAPISATYNVQSGDTLATITTGLKNAVNNSTSFQNIGVSAVSVTTENAVVLISNSTNSDTYSVSFSSAISETLTPSSNTTNMMENTIVGGTVTTNDVLTIGVHDPGLPGGVQSVNYTVQAGNTLANIATGLKNAINANSNLATQGITATSTGAVVNISSTSANATTYTSTLSTNATETLTLAPNLNSTKGFVVGGTSTAGNTIYLTVYDRGLTGGSKQVSYVVQGGNTLPQIASGLATAINNDTDFQGIGVSATTSSAVVNVASKSTNVTSYIPGRSTGATLTFVPAVETNGVQIIAIGGTKTTGNVLTITVYDQGLTGPPAGTRSVSYTVLSGDNLTTITTGLKNAINADTQLQAIGVSAASNSTILTITSTSKGDATSYSKSTSAGATTTMTLVPTNGITAYGYNPLNELLSISNPGQARFEGGTNKAIKSANVQTQVINLSPSTVAVPTYSTSVGNSNATMTVGQDFKNAYGPIILGGGPYSSSVGEVLSLTIFAAGLPGGQQTVSRTLISTDTPSSVASALATSINGNTTLQNVKITAASSGSLLQVFQQRTTYTTSVTGGSMTMTLGGLHADGSQPVTMGGTTSAGNVLTVTASNSLLSGGQRAVSYTTNSTDTYESAAFKLAAAINADAQMQSIHMSAKSLGAMLILTSTVPNMTTFTQSATGTATITIRDFAFGATPAIVGGSPTTGNVLTITTRHPALSGGQQAVNYTVQSGDTLVSMAAGLAAAITGNSNLQAIGVSATSTAIATLPSSLRFTADAKLPPSTSAAKISATDGGNNTKTNTSQFTTTGAGAKQLTFDANGNMTSDGTNQYLWDAENRLTKVIYHGIGGNPGNYSEFVLDGLGRNVKIVEYSNNTVTSTKQFLWCDSARCEERNSSGAVTVLFLGRGQKSNGVAYFYAQDHLASVTEVCDSSQTVVGRLCYDPFGNPTRETNTVVPDMQFAGYYTHERTGLNLTLARAYSPSIGRWLNPDPIGLSGGMNLYGYVGNSPTMAVDTLGLFPSGLANLEGKLREICNRKKCVCESERRQKCFDEAKEIATSLKNAWLWYSKWNPGRYPQPEHRDTISGYYCWDWARIFQKATELPGGLEIWQAYLYKFDLGKSEHWALHLGIAGKDDPDCALVIDDGVFKDVQIHPGDWKPPNSSLMGGYTDLTPTWIDPQIRR